MRIEICISTFFSSAIFVKYVKKSWKPPIPRVAVDSRILNVKCDCHKSRWQNWFVSKVLTNKPPAGNWTDIRKICWLQSIGCLKFLSFSFFKTFINFCCCPSLSNICHWTCSICNINQDIWKNTKIPSFWIYIGWVTTLWAQEKKHKGKGERKREREKEEKESSKTCKSFRIRFMKETTINHNVRIPER